MKKFFFSVFVCLLFTMTSASVAILKDDEGFSYIINYNYLIYGAGNHACTAYDLSSIHIIADNNFRFEFNVIAVMIGYHVETIMSEQIFNIREDYNTGKIFVNGNLIGNYEQWGKTQQEIYYKMKSAALSR